MKTKPTWHRGEVVATDRGWMNPVNNEVLVAIGNLKTMLEAEGIVDQSSVEVSETVTDNRTAETILETSLSQTEVTTEVEVVKKVRKEYTKKETKMKPVNEVVESKEVKIVAEVVEQDPKKKVISEVVEHPLDKQIIAE